MDKQKELNLIVVETAGGRAFLGDCDKSVEEANKRIYANEKIVVFDALVLSQASLMNQATGSPATIPFLGTLHFCVLEPIRRLHIAPAYHYWVCEESQDTQLAFHEEYRAYLKAIEGARSDANSMIAKASPADMRGIEQLAKNMGVNEKTAISSIIQGGLDHKIRTGKIR